MRIAVCVKQIIDTEAEIELEGQTVVLDGQTLIMDPYSEFAVEKAVQLKEEHGGEVTLVCIGDDDSASALRHGLAMGADQAILAQRDDWRDLDSAQKARCLAHLIAQEEEAAGRFDLVMGGWKSGDTANAQVMARLSALLDRGFANMATGLKVLGEASGAGNAAGSVAAGGMALAVTCEVDDGVEVMELATPAVIAAQQGLAEPRYPSVRDVMQARRKGMQNVDISELEIPSSQVKTVSMEMKPPRAGGRILEGELPEVCAQAVELLSREAKVI